MPYNTEEGLYGCMSQFTLVFFVNKFLLPSIWSSDSLLGLLSISCFPQPAKFSIQLPEFLRHNATMSNHGERSRSEAQRRPATKVAAKRAETVQGLTRLPVDWTLKTSIKLSSPQPFQCCQQFCLTDDKRGPIQILRVGRFTSDENDGKALL